MCLKLSDHFDFQAGCLIERPGIQYGLSAISTTKVENI